jgi:DNA-binding transcriptional ArsR family regulator
MVIYYYNILHCQAFLTNLSRNGGTSGCSPLSDHLIVEQGSDFRGNEGLTYHKYAHTILYRKKVTHPYRITGDIVDYLPLAHSTVSQNLKMLRESGWIVGEVEGPSREYCLYEDNIAWFREKVGEIF